MDTQLYALTVYKLGGYVESLIRADLPEDPWGAHANRIAGNVNACVKAIILGTDTPSYVLHELEGSVADLERHAPDTRYPRELADHIGYLRRALDEIDPAYEQALADQSAHIKPYCQSSYENPNA
jgi:hypothetical protein